MGVFELVGGPEVGMALDRLVGTALQVVGHMQGEAFLVVVA